MSFFIGVFFLLIIVGLFAYFISELQGRIIKLERTYIRKGEIARNMSLFINEEQPNKSIILKHGKKTKILYNIMEVFVLIAWVAGVLVIALHGD